jgi:hypothetical protein
LGSSARIEWVAPGADRPAVDELADAGSVAAVRELECLRQDLVDVVVLEGLLGAVGPLDGRLGVPDEHRPVEVHDAVAGHEVAGRVVERRADGVGGAGALGLERPFRLHQVPGPVGVLDLEAGVGAVGLAADDGPGARDLPAGVAGALRDLLRAHEPTAEAVGEPARVRHLVHRVDVERLPVRLEAPHLREGPEDGVVGAVPGVGAVEALRRLGEGPHVLVEPDHGLAGEAAQGRPAAHLGQRDRSDEKAKIESHGSPDAAGRA